MLNGPYRQLGENLYPALSSRRTAAMRWRRAGDFSGSVLSSTPIRGSEQDASGFRLYPAELKWKYSGSRNVARKISARPTAISVLVRVR
jgi:hypothetical protein